MAKIKNEIVEKVIEPVIEKTKEVIKSVQSGIQNMTMEDFLDEHSDTKGQHNLHAAGFTGYWKMILKESFLVRKSFDEWKSEFEKYLIRKI